MTALGTAMISGYGFANETVSTTTANMQPNSPSACVALSSDRDRLSCYDTLFKQPVSSSIEDQAPITALASETPAVTEESTEQRQLNFRDKVRETVHAHALFGRAPAFNPNTSLLDQRWELSEDSKLGTWQIRPYQPVYVFPVFWTSKKNETPSSPNPQNTVTDPQELKSAEGKFQISLKTKAWDNIFGNNGDLWLGYTQSSHWQVYNSEQSRPFRETNYEPEASLMFRTNYNFMGLHGRLLGLTFNHQSNGRSNPLSRSWNRAILNIGLEKDNFAIMLRPWYRFKEDANDDNNPDITHYLGHGDLTAFYRHNNHNFSLMFRNNFKSDNKGAVQFDWAFPIKNNLRGHLQVFDGYGESLIDYNHRATYVGLGISLVDWF
ncbi:phospholipase A [Acinetobacter qingfengensis]|uniref:Phospholipase A1 n=2 Tax=Acinetobacter qingfengensis TaxID=1262585 RepID=A0A1E7REI0_9GAMM|nr:phospholipase A [Acinetobacter qingfengensis]OEY97637.1 phospholipase [Acinetobacter qingfengensis]